MQGLPGLGQSPSLLLLTPKEKSVARGLALSCSSPHSSTAFLCSSPKGRGAHCRVLGATDLGRLEGMEEHVCAWAQAGVATIKDKPPSPVPS